MFFKSNVGKATIIAVLQAIFLVIIFVYSNSYVKQIIAEDEQKTQAILSPVINDIGLTKMDTNAVRKAKPAKVNAGVYLDRIQDFDIVHSRWSYEIYAWFKWNPHQVNFIDLKDSVKGAIHVENSPVKIVNGTIDHIETHSFYLNAKGDSAYVLFHVAVTATRFFDISQYPLDNYLLVVQLEDVNGIQKIALMPDSANSNVSSRVSVNGFEIGKSYVLAKPHTIRSSLGDPRKTGNQVNTYSQLRFAVFIKRGGLGIYLKIFVTLYISVLLGFLSFFAPESDKMRVIVGSLFFAAATLNIIISRIPTTSGISIAEIVNDISLVTILLIAGRETVLKYLFRHNKQLDRLNKWITFAITLVFYLAINIDIPLLCVGK